MIAKAAAAVILVFGLVWFATNLIGRAGVTVAAVEPSGGEPSASLDPSSSLEPSGAPSSSGGAPCSLRVEPAVSRVGDAAVVEATGFTPNGFGMGLAALDPLGSPALSIPFDVSGAYGNWFMVERSMVGTNAVELTDMESGCSASFTWTVLAPPEPMFTIYKSLDVNATPDNYADDLLAPGWRFQVALPNGEQVTVVTGDDGTVEVPVPGGGQVTVTEVSQSGWRALNASWVVFMGTSPEPVELGPVTRATVGVSAQPDERDLPPRLIFANTRDLTASPGGGEVPGATLPPTDAAEGWPGGER